MVLGDFNAHSHLWGGKDDSEVRGQNVEKVLDQHNLCLWNDDTPTFLSQANGSFTSIDLSMCSPSLFMDYTWMVEEDQYGSDHYPIVLSNHFHPPDERVPKWQFHKANWTEFQLCCEQRLLPEDFKHSDTPLDTFMEIVCDIANDCIPKSSPNPKRPQKPWYSDECKEAVRNGRKALKTFKRHPTQ